MNNNVCLDCTSELSREGKLYRCDPCSKDYEKIASCTECEQPLEKLQACGATNYFCLTCNELKSKSRITNVYKLKQNTV